MSDASVAFAWPIRVYYEDTDAGGVVYHASYLRFFERARTEWLRRLGVEQSVCRERLGLVFVIAEMNVKFMKPAYLDEELLAGCALARCRKSSFEVAQTLARRSDGAALVAASAVIACVGAVDFKPRRLPKELDFGKHLIDSAQDRSGTE